jgi:hypothetical protein
MAAQRTVRYSRRDQPLTQAGVMTVRLASVSYTSGDGATTIPSYLASPDGELTIK